MNSKVVVTLHRTLARSDGVRRVAILAAVAAVIGALPADASGVTHGFLYWCLLPAQR